MRIFLMQHAVAKTKEEDEERGLTDDGIQELLDVAKFFKRLQVSIDEIWHSGKKRAAMTSMIFSTELDQEITIKSRDFMNPIDDPHIIRKFLAEAERENKNIMIIGHLPHLSRLASLIVTGDAERPTIKFRNAGIVSLIKDKNRFTIEWLITPDIT